MKEKTNEISGYCISSNVLCLPTFPPCPLHPFANNDIETQAFKRLTSVRRRRMRATHIHTRSRSIWGFQVCLSDACLPLINCGPLILIKVSSGFDNVGVGVK